MSPLDRASVHASYGKVLLDLLVSKGADRHALLQDLNIDPQLLELPDGKITGGQLGELIEKGYAITQDPNLGVWFGLQLKISTHGFLGYAALSSATLGEAIELGVKYAKTRLGLVDIDFFIEGDEAVIAVDTLIQVDKDIERFFLQTFFSSFAVMGENLIGVLPEDVCALCTYPEPPFDQALDDMFETSPPKFGQSVNQIRLPKHYLALPLGMSDPVSRQLMEEQCRKELDAIGSTDDLLLKVRQLINSQPGRFPKLEEVAEKCFMSSRTFKRRLADLGTNYQELLDNERQKKAVDYLMHTHKTVDEIAVLLGYNDPSNFGRAFKRWLGLTPTQYRRQN